MATAQTRYANGAAAPSEAATAAGNRKMPPPMVTLAMAAASVIGPSARTSVPSERGEAEVMWEMPENTVSTRSRASARTREKRLGNQSSLEVYQGRVAV